MTELQSLRECRRSSTEHARLKPVRTEERRDPSFRDFEVTDSRHHEPAQATSVSLLKSQDFTLADKSKFQAIKGVRDILPPESALWNRVEQTAREVFGTFGFAEIRLPIFEQTELFARSVGQETDIVSKEMYTFEDHDSLDFRSSSSSEECRRMAAMRTIQWTSVERRQVLRVTMIERIRRFQNV